MTQVNALVKNLLVIDNKVSNWQSLAAGVGNDTAVLILDSGSDGLMQISDYLTTLAASAPDFTPLQSLQIISHGSAGNLLLGSSTVTTANLKQYTSQLAKIGSSLMATGDILLYGCNVAAGQSGLDFINQFAALTNADVAASNDITGSAAFNGNWQLEASTGSIEAAAALSANTQATYAGSLATVIPVVTITAGITPVEGASGSFIITLDSPAPVGGLTINYSLTGTATLNTDYTVTAGTNISGVTNGSFTVAQGQTTASLTINAAGLDGYDPNETIDLNLHAGSGYSFVSNVTTFEPTVDFVTSSSSYFVSTGDFNGDGKTDMAVANTNTVSVLLRNAANNGFDSKADFATGSSPWSVSVGDFNGDGLTDMAVANSGSNTVSVLLRNAANTGFGPKVDFATGLEPRSVCVGDFNSDGKTDLAVANYTSHTVSMLLRNAANTGFDPKVDVAIGYGPFSVSAGDFNSDGKLDLAVANPYGENVSVLFRNAVNTGFEPKVDLATDWQPWSISIGDFNGDGKTDLAVANISSDTVSVLLRNAANTGFEPKVDLATGSHPISVSIGDFNGDGLTDLAVANEFSNTVSVLLRNAANTGFDPKVDFANGASPSSVCVGDFNGDSKLDLAVANSGSYTVSVLLNNTTTNALLTITDTQINTPPQLPVITPSNISGTLSAADTVNPFNAHNYFDAYTPTGFINGTAMSLALNSTDFDTYLQVIRNGAVLAFNDDSNGTTNSAINYTYQTGDTIYATSSGGLVTGAYSLKLTGTTIPVLEALTTLEDTPITLATTMLPVTDAEQRPDQLTYTLGILPLKGSLSKAGVNLIAGNTFTQADVDNGLISVTPNANFNGTDSFTFSVADGLGGVLANQTFAINVTPVNDAPTLTTFAAPVASGNEDNPIPVTFANLQARGNAGDIDGTVTAFVIKAVSTGSLKIGASVDTATDWSAYYNNVIDATHLAYWTPDANANGILNAITAVAKDNGGLESSTPVQATVSVTAVPDVTVLAIVTPVEGGTAGTFKINLDSPAPVGGLTINYTVSGTATLNTDYTVSVGTNITAVSAGSFTIAAGQTTAKLMINAGNDGVTDLNETVKLNLMIGTEYQFSYATAFDKKVDFATGSSPRSVSIGDFNGDGKLDLAVANTDSNTVSNTVSVMLRNAVNTDFDPKVDFITGSYAQSVSIGDFNGDGKTDLAVTNVNTSTVSVLLRNTANTGFDPKVAFATGQAPYSVSVGDFNGDGKADLAVANSSSNTVSVLLRNTANTGFDPKVDYATGSSPYSVSVGDFNGDGKTDLAVANLGSDTVSVLLRNAANNGFDSKVDFSTGRAPYSVSVGDFNGDGKTDLAVANLYSDTVSVLLRNAANTGFDPKADFATGSYPRSVSVGDFNGDGKADLAVANEGSNTLSVLLRNAANTGFDPKVAFATGQAPYSVSVGDFNGDGKTDLAVANSRSGTVSVLLNNIILPTSLTITDHNPSNVAPTLTTFASTVTSGNEDSQIAIAFANLKAQGNEADVDGTVTAFVIKAVSTGTLLIGTSAGTATTWDASTNNTVDESHLAYWTPATNANGSLNAFTAVAKDNGGLVSATAIQATVAVIDTISPTVTITDNMPNTVNKITSNIAYNLAFSEAVTGLAANDFTLTNGTVSSVTGSGSSWAVNVTPVLGVSTGSIGLTLKAGAVSDGAGNLNVSVTNSSQAIDTVAPVAPKLITNAAFNALIDPQLTLQTSLGTVVLELNPEQAPVTVANMLAYANASFYDNTLFHRVIAGFMVQGGGYSTDYTQKTPTYSPIVLESNNGLSNLRGTIAMARTDSANSATAQFFVNQVDNLFLNYTNAANPGYAVFGKVLSGLTVIDTISKVATYTNDVPKTDVIITSLKQTLAGSSITNTATLTVSDLEVGAKWAYSLNNGSTWTTGMGKT
ncbi:MAG: FG-GAP-like repeat-containing protein, partial [Methylococcaceae bacterium]